MKEGRTPLRAHLLEGRAGTTKTDVQRVIPDRLGVGPHAAVGSARCEHTSHGTRRTTQGHTRGVVWCYSLQDDREGPGRVDPPSCDVEVELADRDAHAADAEVAETENARAVGDDHDLRRAGEEGGVLCEDLREHVLGKVCQRGTRDDKTVRGPSRRTRRENLFAGHDGERGKAFMAGEHRRLADSQIGRRRARSPCRRWRGTDPRAESRCASTSGKPHRRSGCTRAER